MISHNGLLFFLLENVLMLVVSPFLVVRVRNFRSEKVDTHNFLVLKLHGLLMGFFFHHFEYGARRS